MFHYKDGLFFERQDDGSVNIIKTSDQKEPTADNVVFRTSVDSNGWASVVASVSKGGEENGRYYEALAFHNEEPLYKGRVNPLHTLEFE